MDPVRLLLGLAIAWGGMSVGTPIAQEGDKTLGYAIVLVSFVVFFLLNQPPVTIEKEEE